MQSGGIERLVCPEEYQERLTLVGGMNRYGEPNFRIAWAQTETVRQGGMWEADGEQFTGYRDVYLGDGLPHWMLLQWADAGKNTQLPHLPPESDVAFYAQNKCAKTGLQLLGEYPYRGSYQVALTLLAKWFEKGQMFIRAFPLSTEIVEMMVPVIKASMEISLEAKMMFMKEEAEKQEDDYSKAVEDAYQSVKLAPHVKSSRWIADKERSIEKHFNAALITMMHRNRVFQAQGRPNAIH